MLQGQRVWVTRPEAQADRLMALLQEAGGKAYHFPVIEISALADSEQQTKVLRDLQSYYALIFISRNAVIHALRLAPELPVTGGRPVVIAIGAGTGEALSEHGVTDVMHAAQGSGSEAVLQLPLLQADNIRHRKIMIVRGQGGRELLKDSLSARGALVDYTEVYRRLLPQLDRARAKKLWRRSRPDAIVVTSMEGLHNLLRLVHEDHHAQLLHTPLVVVSARMQEQAGALGFAVTRCIEEGVSDEGIVCAVAESFEHK